MHSVNRPPMLNRIAENIWTADGGIVTFFSFPFSTRMTVVHLAEDRLWIHSPVQGDQALFSEVASLGQVCYLISPNKLHHLFLADWAEKFPTARCYAAPGIIKKRPDINFYKELGMDAEKEWAEEIDQTIFRGSPVLKEVVFFHKSSKTLILTDLIENIDPRSLNPRQRLAAKMAGILSPNGRTPIDWRLTMMFGKKEARDSFAIIDRWQPENVVLSHGECRLGGGQQFVRESFSWLV